jgi:hypothetical protein
MPATVYSPLTNSLWRELLDYIPVPALLFRIEESDQARLIFANRDIENVLGFTPAEYVLQSESDGCVQRELNSLVDQIAYLSHHDYRSTEKMDGWEVELTGSTGTRLSFTFRFRIFLSKTAGTHFIVVTLDDSVRVNWLQSHATAGKEPVKANEAGAEILYYSGRGHFVAGSGSRMPEISSAAIVPYDLMISNYLRDVLDYTGGKIYGKDGAAALLKMKPTTLQSKLKKLGVR